MEKHLRLQDLLIDLLGKHLGQEIWMSIETMETHRCPLHFTGFSDSVELANFFQG